MTWPAPVALAVFSPTVQSKCSAPRFGSITSIMSIQSKCPPPERSERDARDVARARRAKRPANRGTRSIARVSVGDDTPLMTDPELVLHGDARFMAAFDVGVSIDLDRASQLVADAARAGLRGNFAAKPRPAAFEFEPLPLRLHEPPPPAEADGLAITEPVEITLYDFGAVSVLYRIPIEGSIASLRERMPAIVEPAALLADARRRVERLVAERIAPAIDRPAISDDVEDYLVLVVAPPTPAFSSDSIDRHDLATLLRAETETLSEEEIRDALAESLRYAADDLVVVDWRAAIVLDRAPEPAVEVLEFLNVQFLEFRHLDRQLDLALAQAYETLRGPGGFAGRGLGWRWSAASRDWKRLARLQVDAALLYESVQNALKLVGDQYLARLMSAAGRRFHLPRWESSILRKIEVLESIYAKVNDAQAHRRAEILEWIIIALIAFEVVFGFMPTLWR